MLAGAVSYFGATLDNPFIRLLCNFQVALKIVYCSSTWSAISFLAVYFGSWLPERRKSVLQDSLIHVLLFASMSWYQFLSSSQFSLGRMQYIKIYKIETIISNHSSKLIFHVSYLILQSFPLRLNRFSYSITRQWTPLAYLTCFSYLQNR